MRWSTGCGFAVLALLAGCASQPAAPEAAPGSTRAPGTPTASAASRPPQDCRAEVARLQAQLASESAERQRLLRAAKGREDTLRRQLDAMKSIERGILEREERTKSETR
jgi:hypothetical protein